MYISESSRSKEQGGRRFVETYFGQLLLVFIGATISIILTLGAAFFMDYHKRQDDRRLSAMMVMSNIEKFSRNLEEIADYLT